MVEIGNDWDEILKDEFEKPYYRELREFLKEEYENHTVYPDKHDIFNALKYTSYSDVKAVILGQDPYHEPGQAHGMAFSVKKGVQQPASLKNIFKELHDDIGMEIPPSDNGCLIPWAERGVLLLNTVLTVREHEANSHRGKGWENFTDAVISKLSSRERPIVFILWGRNAKSKEPLIDQDRHLVITGAHPSPLSAYNGFFGGRYFSRTNRFLEACGEGTIDWDITDQEGEKL
jgi:uracil-DNA glycosylase